jgi:hypothetical protein
LYITLRVLFFKALLDVFRWGRDFPSLLWRFRTTSFLAILRPLKVNSIAGKVGRGPSKELAAIFGRE